MSREWKPGDVALVSTSIVDQRRCSWATDCPTVNSHPPDPHWHVLDSGRFLTVTAVTEARPLVVIDPERDDFIALLREYWNLTGNYFSRAEVGHFRDALRSLIADPKPEEPTGLGAVVEDVDGQLWIRANPVSSSCWMPQSAPALLGRDDYWRPYAKIAAVRVLSEGVR